MRVPTSILCAACAFSAAPLGEAAEPPTVGTWYRAEPTGEIRFPVRAVTSTASDPPGGHDLDSLVRLASSDSLQVRVSEAQVLEARALYQLAVAQAYPQGRARFLFGGPTPEARTTVRNDPSTLTPASLEQDLDFGELGVTFRGNAEAAIPIYTFGQLEKGRQASSHLIEAATAQVTATRAQVIVDLNRAYWGWQLVRSLLGSLDEGARRLTEVLERIEELLDADSPQVTENDRLRLKFALASLSARQAEAVGGKAQIEQALRLLVGRAQGRPLPLKEEKLATSLPRLMPLQELLSGAKSGRPELAALHHVVEAQRAFRDLRAAQLYPTLFFGGFLNFAVTTNATDQTNPFLNDPFNFFDAGVGFGLQVELDFFQRLAQVEQAEAQLAVREQQRELLGEAVELEVRSIHARLEAAREQANRLERAYSSARGWLTGAVLAYDVGAGRADELIDAFLAWATSEAELETTRFSYLVGYADLARAAGRLVEARRR